MPKQFNVSKAYVLFPFFLTGQIESILTSTRQVQLKLAINRIKLHKLKKKELGEAAKKEAFKLISDGKEEQARTKVIFYLLSSSMSFSYFLHSRSSPLSEGIII